MFLDLKMQTCFPLMLGEPRKFDLVPWCFWPGGEAASPDVLHPGKAREHPRGKIHFPPRMFPGFLGPEALKLSVTPARQAELVGLYQLRYFASCGSRVLRTLAQGEPPMTACGGNLIGGEISRNEQCPLHADLRRLRLRNWGRAAPSVSSTLVLNFVLENKTVSRVKSY